MKKTIILIFALCTLMGCGSARQTQLVRQAERDSSYHQNILYDSIYIYHDRNMDRSKDTVYLRETEIEYRYKLLRDTIPYEVTLPKSRR